MGYEQRVYKNVLSDGSFTRVHSTSDAPAFFLLPFNSGTHFVIQLDNPLLLSSSLNSLTTISSCIQLGARAISALTSLVEEARSPIFSCVRLNLLKSMSVLLARECTPPAASEIEIRHHAQAKLYMRN
jgi:hypothetical protein